jgi:hypothetical protein
MASLGITNHQVAKGRTQLFDVFLLENKLLSLLAPLVLALNESSLEKSSSTLFFLPHADKEI